jgi:hypothetical protein
MDLAVPLSVHDSLGNQARVQVGLTPCSDRTASFSQ